MQLFPDENKIEVEIVLVDEGGDMDEYRNKIEQYYKGNG